MKKYRSEEKRMDKLMAINMSYSQYTVYKGFPASNHNQGHSHNEVATKINSPG